MPPFSPPRLPLRLRYHDTAFLERVACTCRLPSCAVEVGALWAAESSRARRCAMLMLAVLQCCPAVQPRS